MFDYGRSLTSDLASAERREWLVTNGLGGFACGTVAGTLTRRYHGLLVAALDPPLGRTLLLAALHETAHVDGHAFPLHVVRWADGTCDPTGCHLIERFRLEGTTPVFTYALADALLEKRIFMEPGRNTTYVRYEVLRAATSVTLSIKALVDHRDYHGETRHDARTLHVERIPGGVRITPGEDTPKPTTSFVLLAAGANVEPRSDWYLNFDLAEERARGFSGREDHLSAVVFTKTLAAGETLLVIASSEEPVGAEVAKAYERRRDHEIELLRRVDVTEEPDWVKQLVLAADQFVVRRPSPEDPNGRTVIAGYPWFADWGRDTMIALPGLALVTGRPEVARGLLKTFARFVNGGMLPNRFPDEGQAPEYNSVDAALWYIEAVRRYVNETGDLDLAAELFPILTEIIASYIRGTRYGIEVDQLDGLLRAGQEGVQLTWMDAKVGDWVVTPRIGKPVEVNALWFLATHSMQDFALKLGKRATPFELAAGRVRANFERRFWNPETGGLFDVVDGPEGDDPSIRPNQIYAIALTESPLSIQRARSVLALCARKLLTSHGLRSLAPDDPRYRGRYEGGILERDGAYHQGTAWGFLLGSFALAHHRLYRNARKARAFLEPIGRATESRCIGTLAEIFDGDPPHTPRGCFAQAWSVAETLRAWRELSGDERPA